MQKSSNVNIDTEFVARAIRRAAAEHVLPRFRALSLEDVETKSGPQDLVTAADLACEKALTSFFTENYPGCSVLGEEAHGQGLATYESLENPSGVVWVIDPVDGTYNFVNGQKEFGIIVACVIDGVTRFGWIYDALSDDMAFAEKGRGAFVNGSVLRSSAVGALSRSRGYMNKKYLPDYARHFYALCEEASAGVFSLRCTAHEYMALAMGKMEFAVYSKSKPWDHLAGALLVSESGGAVTRWDGAPYEPGHVQTGLVVAANEALWRDLRNVIIEPMLEEERRRKAR